MVIKARESIVPFGLHGSVELGANSGLWMWTLKTFLIVWHSLCLGGINPVLQMIFTRYSHSMEPSPCYNSVTSQMLAKNIAHTRTAEHSCRDMCNIL